MMPSDRYDGVWVDEIDGPERLERAKKRRAEQLQRWQARETTSNGQPVAKKKRKRSLKFVPNIVMLEAAARNDLEEVASLLESGVSPDLANEDGLTALHQSCIDGCDDMVKYLIEHKANVNACDNELWTPLHAAAACGHLSIIRYLLKNGGDVMALNLDGNLPADVVEENDEVVNYLDEEMLKLGYDEAAIDELRVSQGKQLLDDLKDSVESGRSLDIQDEAGAAAFHVAAANGWSNVVDFLLENEADFEITDKDGWQPIHAAATWGHETILEILVASGADLDSKTNDSRTPLDLTEESEIIDLIEELKTKAVKYPRKGKGIRRKRSNTSNSSIKRTSIHEKSELSHADTKAEGAALFMQLQNNENTAVSSPEPVKPPEEFNIEKRSSQEECRSSGYASEGSSDAKMEEKYEERIKVKLHEDTREEKEQVQASDIKVKLEEEKDLEEKQKQSQKNEIKVRLLDKDTGGNILKPEEKTIKQSPVPKPPRRGTNSAARHDPQAYINYEIEPFEDTSTCKQDVKQTLDTQNKNVKQGVSKESKPAITQNTELKTHEHLEKEIEPVKTGPDVRQVDKRTTTTTTLPKLPSSDKRKAPEPPTVATKTKSLPEKSSRKGNRFRARSSESSSKKRCIIL